MTGPLDGRREDTLTAELLRRAGAVFGARADAIEPGEVMHAILAVAARIGEEVTRRLDQVPEKQAANFYAAMGSGLAAPLPARLPLAFALSDTAPHGMVAPAGTRLQADANGEQVTFETQAGLDLARGKVIGLGAIDLVQDRIYLAPGAALAPVLPPPAAVTRQLASGAAAGATMLQIEPDTGLAKDMVLRIGDPATEDDHQATKVEGNLVTIAPPLTATIAQGAPVREVTSFAPWASGTRDHQSHALYLGHAKLLDVPSAITLVVSGVTSDQPITWNWYGKTDDNAPAAWLPFDSAGLDDQGRWALAKPKGKPASTAVSGRDGLWLRASMTGASSGTKVARDIRLSVQAGGACDHPEAWCGVTDNPTVAFEGVAMTTPIVQGKPFYPFGREPRLYDAFYVGCKEALGKAGASVRLCFTLGGAMLGRLVGLTGAQSRQVFAVGTDGLFYRAILSAGTPTFTAVPLPAELKGMGVASQAALAGRIDGASIRIALAGKGCVYTASFNELESFADGKAPWQKLAIGTADAAGEASVLHIGPDAAGAVLALWRVADANGAPDVVSLLEWASPVEGAAASVTPDIDDLVPVQGFDAVLVIAADGSIEARDTVAGSPHALGTIASPFPATLRAAWTSPGAAAAQTFYVAGYGARASTGPADAPRALTLVQLAGGGVTPAQGPFGEHTPLPITFEPPYDPGNDWPVITIAETVPARIAAQGRPVAPAKAVGDGADIGMSTNMQRQFVCFDTWTVVQHADQGLMVRTAASGGRSVANQTLSGSYRLAIDQAEIAAGSQWLVLENAPDGQGYWLQQHGVTGDWLLLPFAGTDTLPSAAQPLPTPRAIALQMSSALAGATGVLNSVTLVHGSSVALWNVYIDNPPFTAPTRLWVLVEVPSAGGGAASSIWLLTRPAPGTGAWTPPAGFVTASSTPGAHSAALEEVPTPTNPLNLSVANTSSYFETARTQLDEVMIGGGATALRDAGVTVAESTVMNLGADAIFALPARIIDRGGIDTAAFLTMPPPWNVLGPNQPANPDLSWEYWNGSSWSALDGHGLSDTTADLRSSGAVVFTVPGDLSETQVGGSKNRWIRARLVGGDYGEARTIIKSDTTGTGTPNTSTTQSVTRDVGAVRAPYAIGLALGYCSSVAVPPEKVLTNDSLVVLDQSSANLAGLPVRFFAPAATLFDPVAAPAAPEPAGEGACCEQWDDNAGACAPEPESPPSPGQGWIACDSWDDPAATASGSLQQVVLIGLDQAPQGDAVSFYIDAEVTGAAATLTARAFRAGEFAEIIVIDDTSSGLNEPGVIRLALDRTLDGAELLGTEGFWIALMPEGTSGDWAPRLRGVYLNGVVAASVETRGFETIGTATGAPDQRFNLVAAPIDPDSLELWVDEPVGDEEAAALGANDDANGIPGRWIPWTRKEELPPSPSNAPPRAYALDALTGEISFGNGANALAPPMGAALLARTYRKVTGNAANGIAAGAQLQTISPMVGVDKVTALGSARGGADPETTAQALAWAPAKLVSGDRLTTLADLESYLPARLPWVAQARAAHRRGRIRLVVAGRGDKVLPTPSALKGVGEVLAAAATFGVAGSGRLDIVGPQMLPLCIAVGLETNADVVTLASGVRAVITAFLDHETGGYDHGGWPIGARPDATDIAAALGAIAGDAVLGNVVLTRKDTGAPLPETLPGQVLVRIDPQDVTVTLTEEALA
jgi:hypothetical protein